MAHGNNSKEKVVYVGDSRVRRGNGFITPPDYTAYPGKSEAFIPNFLLKEWMVGVVVLVGILVLTISEPAPLGFQQMLVLRLSRFLTGISCSSISI